MSAASSWTMSADAPPTKLVNSLSCTELTSTGTMCTWIDGCDLFHDETMLFIAFTVVGCHTYVAKLRFVTFCLDFPACAVEATRATHSMIAVQSPTDLRIEDPPFLGTSTSP